MAYTVYSPDTEAAFDFASEDAYEAADRWYDTTDKSEMIRFCTDRGVNILADEKTLVEDWSWIAKKTYADAM